MSAVTKFFFRSPYPSQTTGSIIRWWEARRITYNVAVGTTGLISLGAATLIETLPPAPGRLGVPLGVLLVYGVLANLCFCFGPLVDAAVCRRWGENYSALGPALFRYGFAFAVGLSFLPIPIALLWWGVRLLGLVR
jgi:hypothetical protein